MGEGAVLPTGTVTFLFTDLVGSTRLWEQYPTEMRGALARHDEIVRSSIEAHGGYVFATGGDGFAAAFAGAGSAVDAAISAQRGLGAEAWPAEMVLSARMGLHSGEAEERDGDYFGPTLNRVGRLHAVGHGGQILVSETTERLVRDHVELIDLGRFRLRGFDEESGISQVAADGLAFEFDPLRTLDSVSNNLPLAVDEFVGRDLELRELITTLRESRLVTLTGVGGTGKTRLAVEAASVEVGRFSDGAWLVELAGVSEAAAVPFVVADAVGAVQHDGLTMAESLVRSLSARGALLLLDNCEHLLDAVAELVATIVARCPDLVVLATSREGLAVRGERILAIPSLGVEEGAELFLTRAAAAGAVVAESEIDDVAEVVMRLDGLPLAIELAAARANALSVKEIAGRLDDRFRLLRGGGRGRRERHQTLWNTVAWSYDLLSEDEQQIFNRLSVFAGGFTMDAAQDVCAPELDEFAVEDAVLAFVDRSLVVAESTPSGSRYTMLETLRQFGEAQLDDAETGRVRARHAAWFADFAERSFEGIWTDVGIEWNRRQLVEIDNLRTVVYGQDPAAACRVVAAFQMLWWVRSDYEIIDWALHVLEHGNEAGERRTFALLQGLVAAQQAGRLNDAHRLEKAIDSTELDGVAHLWWLQYLVFGGASRGAATGRGDIPVALPPEQRSGLPPLMLELALSLDNDRDRALWVGMAAGRSMYTGEFETAHEIWRQHTEVARGAGTPALEVGYRYQHGVYLVALGGPGARADLERVVELAGQFDWPLMQHVSLVQVAVLHAAEGEFTEARRKLADAIRFWIRTGDLQQLGTTLHFVASVLTTEGDEAGAQEVWRQLADPGFGTPPTVPAKLKIPVAEPPATSMTDGERLEWARDLASELAS